MGTRNRLARECGGAAASVSAMTTAKAAPSAELANHLCPSSTYPEPSRRAVVDRSVGLDPACYGSVMAKHERMRPSTNRRR